MVCKVMVFLLSFSGVGCYRRRYRR